MASRLTSRPSIPSLKSAGISSKTSRARRSNSSYFIVRQGGGRLRQPLLHPPDDLVRPHPDLLERVALADRDGAVLERLPVHGDTPRRADLVLASVTTTDRPREIV